MTKIVINSEAAPKPIGPYNQAAVSGNLIFTSGQIPIDPKTGNVIIGDIAQQTRSVLTHLSNVLKAADSSLAKVIKTTVFLKDMNDFAKMNEVYAEFFRGPAAPARSTVEVARLPKNVSVEIEAVAEV